MIILLIFCAFFLKQSTYCIWQSGQADWEATLIKTWWLLKKWEFLGGEKSGGSLQAESESIRDSRSAQGLLIGGRCNTCNESASARCGFSLMSENPSCPWKASGTLSHVCTAHIAREFSEEALCIGWRSGERLVPCEYKYMYSIYSLIFSIIHLLWVEFF